VTIGPIQFDQPWWLLLAPALIALAWLIGRRAIAGLSPALRRTALGVRAALITLLVVALADPSWRKGVDDVAVMIVLDMSESMPAGADRAAASYIEEASKRAKRDDRLGLVLAASKPLVADLPSSATSGFQVANTSSRLPAHFPMPIGPPRWLKMIVVSGKARARSMRSWMWVW